VQARPELHGSPEYSVARLIYLDTEETCRYSFNSIFVHNYKILCHEEFAMFGMGMPEIIMILAIALIVLGPKKLPEIAKSLGRGIAEFKKATQDFKESIEVDNDLKEAKKTIQEIKGDIQETVKESMAQGAASVEAGADDDYDHDGVPEEDLEHVSGKERTETPQEPVEDKPQQVAEQDEAPKDA
jgi:TatA/E family protein of Tat protein translocase